MSEEMESSSNLSRVSDPTDDADSLLDETVANSNQNNSNCSSPSRMSDSVSLTTDSSQDNSLCTPEREAKTPFLPKSRRVIETWRKNTLRSFWRARFSSVCSPSILVMKK